MDFLHKELDAYVAKYSSTEEDVLKKLSRETYLKIAMPQMLSGHLQGQLLTFMIQLLQPKNVLEIGTFTGYATICLAKGLGQEGTVFTIDTNEELSFLWEKYFAESKLQHKIKTFIGEAAKIIPTLDYEFDFVFIDADKGNYSLYFDLVIDKVRKGGVIVADNVLWSGKVIEEKKDKDTQAIHTFNEKVAADQRVENFILPIRDGLNVIRKVV